METFLTSSKAKIIKLFEGKIETIYKKKRISFIFSLCSSFYSPRGFVFFKSFFPLKNSLTQNI